MSNSLPPLLHGLAAAMQHLTQRQRVLAGNIANVDTPGFKALELDQPDFSTILAASSGGIAKPRDTLTSAMQKLGVTPASPTTRPDLDVSEVKPDGNNVTIEDQLLKLSNLQSDYSKLTNIYRKNMQLMKIAVGRSSG